MSEVPKTVRTKEVGPRAGFQFEKGAISQAGSISDRARPRLVGARGMHLEQDARVALDDEGIVGRWGHAPTPRPPADPARPRCSRAGPS